MKFHKQIYFQNLQQNCKIISSLSHETDFDILKQEFRVK